MKRFLFFCKTQSDTAAERRRKYGKIKMCVTTLLSSNTFHMLSMPFTIQHSLTHSVFAGGKFRAENIL